MDDIWMLMRAALFLARLRWVQTGLGSEVRQQWKVPPVSQGRQLRFQRHITALLFKISAGTQ